MSDAEHPEERERPDVHPSQIGLYDKYFVERLVPSTHGIVHDGCRYFVLDLTHDPIARIAARVYAIRAAGAGYTKLASDLRTLLSELTSKALHDHLDPREL